MGADTNGTAPQLLVDPGRLNEWRFMVWREEVSASELHRRLSKGEEPPPLSLRTLQHYVYQLDHPDVSCPPPPTGVAWWNQGERSPKSLLSRAQVVWIRAQRGKLSSQEVADILGRVVQSSTVRAVWNGQNWHHISQEESAAVARRPSGGRQGGLER
jgi:hypothetical protein